MNELKKMQCRDIEKRMIISLNEVLDILERTILDVEGKHLSYCAAKKTANMYVPVMLRNANRLREFRLFMKDNDIEESDVNLLDRVDKYIQFFC